MTPSSSGCPYSRRKFLQAGAGWVAAAPLLARALDGEDGDEVPVKRVLKAPPPPVLSPTAKANAKVAIVRCREYGAEFQTRLARAFDQLGGVGRLVKDKTVTIKLNLTGSSFDPLFGRPVGDSFMTHPDTAFALASQLFKAGARRVRFVESTQRLQSLQEMVSASGGWDLKAFESLGKVEWENTRNLGSSKQYATVKVPSGGYLFSSFDLNRAYEDTDVLVSLAKLKNHVTCGVTLAMKNCFGITPNALYGDEAPNERATAGRGPLHERSSYKGSGLMPGELKTDLPDSPFLRVPRIVADLCEARPIHLSVIDGVVSMKGGEGPWAAEVKLTTPGVLIVGLNPVSADAVGTAVMGYSDPRAVKGVVPFQYGDNHLLLAEQRGVGVLDLKSIEVVGEPIQSVIYPYG
ncbi:MAG: DUF362 domain-containing protein [Verrucomicrobiales bacterium]|nr:DUF362 domain-containing protein [Verrucomicrobiales bacterium]